MFKFMLSYYLISKSIWEGWKAENDDPDDPIYLAGMTPDETFYVLNMPKANQEQENKLLSINGAFKLKGGEFRDFQKANPLMFTETGDGQPPVEREKMIHPQSANLDELSNLYDGTNATLTFQNGQDSTWVIPYDCLPHGGLDDVMKPDGFIRLKRNKFGPDGIPGDKSRYIYESPETILVKTYPITSVTDNNGTITVSLNIPAL